jgi:FKBP-type peptidyl-prolyl cis-trans isomerase
MKKIILFLFALMLGHSAIAQDLKTEQAQLSTWAKAHKLKKKSVKTTPSGMMVAITKKGTGAAPVAGTKVKVHYTGTLLDGKKFDSSVDRGEPFQFVLGAGQVIKGWDEGIALLTKGAKATLMLPSSLAYGARGAGGSIPPNTPLIFEVELVDF